MTINYFELVGDVSKSFVFHLHQRENYSSLELGGPKLFLHENAFVHKASFMKAWFSQRLEELEWKN